MAFIPKDPLFSKQLWLRNTKSNQYDINVVDVWDDYTGDGVRVAAIDTGYDLDHRDLDDNLRTDIDWDYTDKDANPTSTGNHGQAVLGIIGAEANNGYGGVGVAWDAELVAYRGGFGFTDAAGLGSNAFSGSNPNAKWAGVDVINYSVATGHFVGKDIYDQLEKVSAQGRDGLGTIFVKANGNFRDEGYESTGEKGNTTQHTVSVGAVRHDGWVTSYSTPGANLLVSGIADDNSNKPGVVTTLQEGGGRLQKDFGFFYGTSAATPQVVGVTALMLEANPDLGWRDVQTILAYSARHVGSDVGKAANSGAPSNGRFEIANQENGATWFWNDATNWNGGALHFSNDYGYGLVDAKAAVRLAETWNQKSTSSNQQEFVLNLDPGSVSPGQSYSSVEGKLPRDMIIEYVSANVDFRADDLNDVKLLIESPDGTRVELLKDHNSTKSFSGDWNFGTNAFRGTIIEGASNPGSNGTWKVLFADDDGQSNGAFRVTDIDVTFHGRALNSKEAFIFTDEFSNYARGAGGHGTTFNSGVVGSVGVVNAAAVSSNTRLDFSTDSGRIDGVSVVLKNIGTANTGDGNDTITGDGTSSVLSSGRGNDTVKAGAADTDIDAGPGNDVVTGGSGNDTIDGGAGSDTAVYSGGLSNYQFSSNSDGSVTVADARSGSPNGTDILRGVEK